MSAQPVRRVLLLNPPGDRPYIRDQFCSHLSKGTYYWQPLDLVVLSGPLAAAFDVQVVDGIAQKLGPGECLERIAAFAPDATVMLTGSDSWPQDLDFARQLRERTGSRLVLIGDLLREDPESLLHAYPFVDAGLTDFVTNGLVEWLSGRPEAAENMILRDGEGFRRIHAGEKPRSFRIATPRYELFDLRRYSMPYHRHHPYAAVIASTWCPYLCSFCPFARTPYRYREADDVLANLRRVAELGIRQVHFVDYTFGGDRPAAAALVRGMLQEGFRFSWTCNSRVDLVDRPTLEEWARAGCDLIEFGVESGNQAILDRYEKGTTIRQLRDAFRWCRELGLRTLGTFILGLPGETPDDLERTTQLALELDPDYASFNIASPRMGTPLRHQLIERGLITAAVDYGLDSSRGYPVFETADLPAELVARAHRRALRRFYLRPGYIARRLVRLGSPVELRHAVANGTSVILQALASRGRRPETPPKQPSGPPSAAAPPGGSASVACARQP